MPRWTKRTLRLGLLGLGCLAAVVGGALFYVRTGAGSSRLRDAAVAKANAVVKGKLEVGRVFLAPRLIILEDLKLYDPEGALVAEIARLEAQPRLSQLLERDLDLESVKIVRPRVYLQQDARGLNLSRAIEARALAPEKGLDEEGRPRLEVRVKSLSLEEGSFELVTPGQRFALEGLAASGNATYEAFSRQLDVKLSAQGRQTSPFPAPVSLKLGADGAGEVIRADLEAALGALKLVASGRHPGPGVTQLRLDSLVVPPAEARALFAPYPLLETLKLSGEIAREADAAQVTLHAEAGTARAELSARVAVSSGRVSGGTLSCRGLDLRALVGVGPRAPLSLTARGEGAGTSLQDLEGAASVELEPATVEGQRVGPLRARLSASGGRLRVHELLAQLPGLTLTAQGWTSAAEAQAQAKLLVKDLAKAGQVLQALGVPAPLLGGEGEVSLSVEGRHDHLGATLTAALPRLQLDAARAERLSVQVKVPDLSRPFHASAEVSAASLSSGQRTWEEPRLTLASRDRLLTADLRARSLEALQLHVAGTVDPDGRGATLSDLQLLAPRAAWTLSAPARVRFDEAQQTLEPLALRSGAQALTVRGSRRGARVEADVELRALELSLLPRALVAPQWGLAGRVSGTASLRGTLAAPRGEASLSWEELGGFGVTGLSGEARAQLTAERVAGTAELGGALASAKGSFDFPVRRGEPVQARLDVARLDVASLLAALRQAPRAAGAVSASLELSGTLQAPALRGALSAAELRVRPRAQGAALLLKGLAVEAHSADDGALEGTVALEAAGGRANATVVTPFTLAQWRTDPPSRAQVLAARVVVGAELTGIDLGQLSAAGLTPEPMTGRAWVKAALVGPLRTPRANLELTLAGASLRGLPATDLSGTARAAGDEVSVRLAARQAGRPLASFGAWVGASLESLLGEADLSKVPVELRGRAGPVLLSELRSVAADPDQRPGEKLEGALELRVQGEGSLEDPKLSVRAQLAKLSVGKLSLGSADATWTYHRADNALFLEAHSPGGGVLTGKGRAKLDLGLPAVRRGVSVGAAPIELDLHASRFDLQMLSGLSRDVRSVGGLLTAHARLRGTAGLPRVQGKVEVTSGSVSVQGFGEYRDAHLLLEGDENRLTLRELKAVSGGGSAKVSGSAERRGEGYTLALSAEANKFPVVSDDQLLATASLRVSAQGEATRKSLDLRELLVPEAHFELPEVKRKDLQQLSRPDDIVVLKEGRPVDRSQRKRLPPSGKAASFAVPREDELPFQVRAVITAPQNLWLKSSDVNAEVGLSEGFRVEYARGLLMKGEIRVLRGRAYVIGRKFDVKRDGQVRFVGPATLPYVDLSAVHVNEGEGVTVTVAVVGQGKDIAIKPTSEPPLSESEIYTLLATGRRSLKRNSGATMSSADAASIIGSLAAAQLKNVLAKKLPLDVISIEAGEDKVLEGAKLEAGRYLGDQLYLGYTGRIDADRAKGQNAHEAKLEYRLNARWSFEAKFGDAPAGGADIVWSRDY